MSDNKFDKDQEVSRLDRSSIIQPKVISMTEHTCGDRMGMLLGHLNDIDNQRLVDFAELEQKTFPPEGMASEAIIARINAAAADDQPTQKRGGRDGQYAVVSKDTYFAPAGAGGPNPAQIAGRDGGSVVISGGIVSSAPLGAGGGYSLSAGQTNMGRHMSAGPAGVLVTKMHLALVPSSVIDAVVMYAQNNGCGMEMAYVRLLAGLLQGAPTAIASSQQEVGDFQTAASTALPHLIGKTTASMATPRPLPKATPTPLAGDEETLSAHELYRRQQQGGVP